MTTLSVYEFDNLLNNELESYSDFYIEIFNPDGNLVYNLGRRSESLDRYETELFFVYPVNGNQSWLLRVRTTPTFFANLSYRFIYVGLVIAMSLSVLLGVAVYFGHGTTFKLNFCFKKIEQLQDIIGSNQVNKTQDEEISFHNSRVLIIDDQLVNIIVIEKTLIHYGINADYTEYAKDGIKLASEKSYDLILMDIHMPEMDGFEAASKIKEIGIETPIIALSADVTPNSQRKAFENGMQDYLTKPFSREKLLVVLKKYLLQAVDGN